MTPDEQQIIRDAISVLTKLLAPAHDVAPPVIVPPAQTPPLTGRQVTLQMPELGNQDTPVGIRSGETVTGWVRHPSADAQYNIGFQRVATANILRSFVLTVNGVAMRSPAGKSAMFTIANDVGIQAAAGDVVALQVTNAVNGINTGDGDGFFQIQRTR